MNAVLIAVVMHVATMHFAVVMLVVTTVLPLVVFVVVSLWRIGQGHGARQHG